MAGKRVLLAWEAGAGRGHVVSLAAIARQLRSRFEIDAALRRLDHARELTADCGLVFRGPALAWQPRHARGPGGTPAASWGEYLADIGFADPQAIAAQVGWWQRLMRERGYCLVVADYAPCAMLAARSLDIPVLAVGTGFGLPPGELKCFPDLWADDTTRLFDEAELVSGLNRALLPLGLRPLDAFPEIYRAAETIVRTPAPFDPYAAWRTGAAVALHPLAIAVPDKGRRAGIFLYLSSGPQDGGGLAQACMASGLPLLAYAPALSPAAQAALRAQGADVCAAPVPPGRIARECSLLVHHGQPGMAIMGLAAGMAQAVLPLHAEQRFHAAALEKLGGGAMLQGPVAERDGALLRELATCQAGGEYARRASAGIAGFLEADHAAVLAARLDALLQRLGLS